MPENCTDSVGLIGAENDDRFARYSELHQMGENSPALLAAKVTKAGQLFYHQLSDRVRVLREVARLAELQGRELLGCAYRVRAIRLLGSDVYHELPLIVRTLESYQFAAEAEALSAMHEDPARAGALPAAPREPWQRTGNPRGQPPSSGWRITAIPRSASQ